MCLGNDNSIFVGNLGENVIVDINADRLPLAPNVMLIVVFTFCLVAGLPFWVVPG